MSLTIEVSAETARRVQEAADSANVPVDEYLRRLVERAVNGTGGAVQSGDELVRFWRKAGVIGAWKNRSDASDSVAWAERLRNSAQTRTPG